ncbi:MAG: hypothetical protein GX595_05475 [Lentisphaerae bacterium]|nr:hypothetical protein [Lentisphaerota bacterium]
MGKLGTISGIVAAVLAVVAAVLSFMISQKRGLYEERAGKLAEAVARMVAKVDQNSNSGLQARTSFTRADKQSGVPEDGSLSWKTYVSDPSTYEGTLNQAVTLAGVLNQRRDSLAEAFVKAAAQLELDVDPAQLRDLSSDAPFTEAVTAVQGHVEAVSARDKAMIDALVKAAETINHPLDAGAFSRREETQDAEGKPVNGPFPYAAPLDEFGGNVKGLVTRCNDYAEAIASAIQGVTKFSWQADPEKIKDEREYSGVLTSLQNDFADINEQLALYEQARKEVAEQKQRIAQLVEEVEETSAELKDVKRDLTKAQAQVARLQKATGFDGEAGAVDPNLAGEIVDVNNEWNFVVVNLGRVNRVPENLRMLVARDDRLVARLQVSKVFGKVSVAEILPEANIDAVKVGDRVILPKEQE